MPATPQINQPASPAPAVSAEVIATAIEEIATAMKAFNSTRLTREAVVVLIHDQSGVPKRTIRLVLDSLNELENTWLKPSRRQQ